MQGTKSTRRVTLSMRVQQTKGSAIAMFDSTCECGERIHEGDKIFKIDHEWVCQNCMEDSRGS